MFLCACVFTLETAYVRIFHKNDTLGDECNMYISRCACILLCLQTKPALSRRIVSIIAETWKRMTVRPEDAATMLLLM